MAQLVLSGIKTATCSALWQWEAEGSDLPEVGLKTIVLDGNNHSVCIIETTEVTVRAFSEVDAIVDVTSWESITTRLNVCDGTLLALRF
ncbi:ASCH domain-containing protein [Pleurocapsales cyanobacterium LEGE 06147]|nr:ASCH domain-containing protein [Pleurocapsales cyanobacterium LEGE 06147]